MRFGEGVDYEDFLKDCFALAGKLGKDYITNKQVMIELYETKFGIYDHRASGSALSSVKYNKCENYVDHFLMGAYLETYLYRGVNKYMGMSFDEFIDRPRWEMDKIVEVIERFRKKEGQAGEDALSEIKKQM